MSQFYLYIHNFDSLICVSMQKKHDKNLKLPMFRILQL